MNKDNVKYPIQKTRLNVKEIGDMAPSGFVKKIIPIRADIAQIVPQIKSTSIWFLWDLAFLYEVPIIFSILRVDTS